MGPWLGAMARNRAADAGRQHARAVRLREGAAEPAAPCAHWESGVGADEVLSAIGALPEAYAETLMMRLVEGLTGPQIAEKLGLTHGSVRVNLCRGMKLLRERLGLDGAP